MKEFSNIKFIIFVDAEIDINDVRDVIWYFTNNIDPGRDCFLFPAQNEETVSHLIIDGTRKTKKFDDFDRPWPNVICSDEETIKAVDDKWSKLGLGEFIQSPSMKYRKLLRNEGAVAKE